MIQAKELRLNNWVYEEVLGNVRVSAVLSDMIAVVAKNMKQDRTIEDKEYSINLLNVKPIRLTTGVLANAGFKQAFSSFHDNVHIYNMKKDGFEIQYHSELQDGLIISAPKSDEGFIVHCPFVHQLQSLYFCLQGRELTIKL